MKEIAQFGEIRWLEIDRSPRGKSAEGSREENEESSWSPRVLFFSEDPRGRGLGVGGGAELLISAVIGIEEDCMLGEVLIGSFMELSIDSLSRNGGMSLKETWCSKPTPCAWRRARRSLRSAIYHAMHQRFLILVDAQKHDENVVVTLIAASSGFCGIGLVHLLGTSLPE